jgi:NAD(P)-dependent dehydrogenase (short-subunit alcohol dehydrogenase family)
MELRLDGKVVIVTCGSKGIGRATALGFLDEGASVLVCARGQRRSHRTRAQRVSNASHYTYWSAASPMMVSRPPQNMRLPSNGVFEGSIDSRDDPKEDLHLGLNG